MPSTLGDDDLELDGASATFKLDDSTFGGITRCIDGISSLTLPLPNNTSAYVDTGIDLPAYSVIRYIFIKKTTPGVNGNGTLYISNFAMASDYSVTNESAPNSGFDEKYGDWDYPGGESKENGYNLEGAAGTPNFTGHFVINGIVDGRSGRPAYDVARNLFLKIAATGDAPGSVGATAAVIGVFVVYDTFDIS